MKTRASSDNEAKAILGHISEHKVADLERLLRGAIAARDSARADLGDANRALNLITAIDAAKLHPPRWLTPKVPAKGHHATLCLLITDTHFDEVVRPEEIDGLNAYNREIAELRLRKVFDDSIKLARHYLAGVTYDGVCLMLGGDIFSGLIHEELRETNQAEIMASVIHWIEPLEAGIDMLAEEFGKVHVVGVPGNHGRNTKKPRFKGRATDNFDWLLYKIIQRDYRRDGSDRVTVQAGNAMDAHFKIYSTRYLLTHGDQFKGGSGISGALAPLMLGAHRKTRRQSAAGQPYDIMVMGHWHHEVLLPSYGVMMGPCLKGFDEHSYGNNYTYSPPAQALWITTPEHGVTWKSPVYVMDRKKEGW